MKEIEEQLNELKIEDYIWLLFIFVSIVALISNYYERKYVVTKNKKDFKIYKTINIDLLIISFLVYLYFSLLSYKKYKQTLKTGNIRELFFSKLNLFATSLFLIAGLLNIFIESKSDIEAGDIFL